MSWPAAAALALALGAPSLAHAQQGGLFPLAPIRRERVPCQMEDPVYRLYRQEYFGYHPTCWRKFPAGWGCPSPEAPNPAEAFRLLPRDKPPADLGPDGGDENAPDTGGMAPNGAAPGGAGAGAGGASVPGNPPPLPSGERSPFELDRPATVPPAGGNPPATNPPAARPGGERSPFEIDPRPTTPAPGAAPGGANPLPSLPGGDAPVVPAPGGNAPTPTPPPAPRDGAAPGDPAASADPAGVDQPLLALPDPTVGPTSIVSSDMKPLPEPPTAPAVKAPRRTGFLGNLFNRGVLRR